MSFTTHHKEKEQKRAQQTNSITHEQRGKYDFFLPNKKKGGRNIKTLIQILFLYHVLNFLYAHLYKAQPKKSD